MRTITASSSGALDRASLVGQLKSLGITPGQTLMVHTSMRKVGPVADGAAGMLAALFEALGPSGNLLMVLSGLDEPFDYLRTPVDTEDMGVLPEVFRTTAGVLVNDHAADRFAAYGPRASWLLNPTPLHHYHGKGSVLERLVECGGKVLRLGAFPDTVTLTHYAEYLCSIPAKHYVRRRYVRADIGEQWIDSLDDTDGIAVWSKGDYFPQIFLDYRDTGAVSLGPVGACTAELFDASAFTDFAVTWMDQHLVGEERIDRY